MTDYIFSYRAELFVIHEVPECFLFSGDAVRNCPPLARNVSFGVVMPNISDIFLGCFFIKFIYSLLGHVKQEH